MNAFFIALLVIMGTGIVGSYLTHLSQTSGEIKKKHFFKVGFWNFTEKIKPYRKNMCRQFFRNSVFWWSRLELQKIRKEARIDLQHFGDRLDTLYDRFSFHAGILTIEQEVYFLDPLSYFYIDFWSRRIKLPLKFDEYEYIDREGGLYENIYCLIKEKGGYLPGWYFGDETESIVGPYETLEECQEMFAEHCRELDEPKPENVLKRIWLTISDGFHFVNVVSSIDPLIEIPNNEIISLFGEDITLRIKSNYLEPEEKEYIENLGWKENPSLFKSNGDVHATCFEKYI